MISTGIKASILAVIDDTAICRILQVMLVDGQYRVQTSHSVSEALAAVEQNPFDAYVMDYKLQDGSGLDIAERIRSKRGRAPIILISGYDRSLFASRAAKLGITEFIEKPFSGESICSLVKKAIGSGQGTGPPVPESQAIVPKRRGLISRILSRF